jgi:hypothetical protein
MRTRIIPFITIVLALVLKSQMACAQPLTGYNFKIVNMMPHAQSSESNFDSETNIAVEPDNTAVITGSAFTLNPTGSTSTAPIYVSADGGNTWTLNNIVPSGNGMTGDISLGFASSSGNLYAGILRGGSSFRCMVLRTNTPTASTTMTTLVDRSTVSVDQPWISATTVNDATSTPRDRVFAGDNLFGSRKSVGGSGKTAEVMASNDAGSAPPSGFSNDILEPRNTFEEDMPAIRTAIHSSGVVYAVYYSWTSGNPTSERCDVVVVRDDNFATGSSPFTALTDAGDSKAGQRVVTNVLVPAFGVSLGNNRLVASNLAIAVDPKDSANVFIAWCDRVGTTDYTVHFRRSTNSGQSWGSSDWLTITNATNPGIAITTTGKVGLIYQQLTGSGATARWETHFRYAALTGSTFTDDILSTFLDSDLSASTISPSLGDYLRIQAVGNTFYGVFPASNRPINSNFPHSVTFQRNADFTSNQIRNLSNSANVSVSVDPFFFKISPKILTICDKFPIICNYKFITKIICHIPPYPCGLCPWPCFECPPFEIPIEDIYTEVFGGKGPETVLFNPYFHLILDGFDPQNFEINITNRDGEPVALEMNRTDKGYAITFHPSKNNYNPKEGMHGLKLMILPKNEAAAKKGAEFNYNLVASDYHFKEYTAMKK